MAFTLQNWGRISTSANEPVVTLTAGTVVGSFSTYNYYSPIDTQGTCSAANYFASVVYDLSVGDTISVYSATELSTVGYTVTALNQSAKTVTIAPVSGSVRASGVVTNAQMLAGIYANPVQLIPAPGASQIIVVTSAVIELVYVAPQFTAGGVVTIQYGATVHGAGTNAFTTTITAANINNSTANSLQVFIPAAQAWETSATLANLGIYISCATQEFASGGGSLNYDIAYRIVNI